MDPNEQPADGQSARQVVSENRESQNQLIFAQKGVKHPIMTFHAAAGGGNCSSMRWHCAGHDQNGI